MAKLITSVALLAVLATSGAAAQTALRDVARVRDGIIQVGMAYEISEQCSSISARLLRGLSFLQELKSYAKSQGFSDAEIEAYVDDRAEKRKLERIARQQLAALGAVDGRPATYCRVGRNQIAQNTRVGWMLR
ncbi:DUF5333 domain-containing protein [Yoonia sediminilitoris]|uniref:NADH dehydrogenase subunit E n=1 Tax=Yoonia sediminilitoris TaxID=1286148 RepID=A0A2T6KRA2_9RHOB|nr:DUF5333 domain-containing protein [Yoonia sediminilitoris]PUB19080.1 hypothetical protein C8N45_101671 [Yoonia sediminilitoris]RCW99248.1 hypothetical protein DFP92_101671 [Yoonia sediminilitoris]